jgi:type IV secretion system protein VirD4
MSKVNAFFDEAASLGPNMGCVEDAIDKYRGFGIRLFLFYQSMAQLKKCFPNDQDQNVLANTTQIFFGVNDLSAEYISKRLGDQTIVVNSGGRGSGTSMQSSNTMNQNSTSESTNRNHNWSQIGRRLLKPEEILSMSERIAITFVPGMSPIMTILERYYETKKSKADGVSGWYAIAVSLCMLLIVTCCLMFAMKLLKEVHYA